MDSYFGTYQRFETVSKNEAAALLGADNLVGDIYEISIDFEDGQHKAWLVNRFDRRIGYFSPRFSRELSVYKARDFTVKAILSFVAFTDEPEPGAYWGEMAVICYSSNYSHAFEAFVDEVAQKMQDGERIDLDLADSTIEKIIDSDGEWLPKTTTSLPKVSKGTVIMKSKRSLSDKMVEQGRKRNPGCYVGSIVFIIVVIVAIVLLLRACGVF